MNEASTPIPPAALPGISFTEWEERLRADGLGAGLAKDLWRLLHREDAAFAERFQRLPPNLQRWWRTAIGDLPPEPDPALRAVVPSIDGRTQKLLIRLHDGQDIETVIMRYAERHTLCLSTQAGCAMGCVFCATGQMGFSRHLSSAEIVSQVIAAKRLLREQEESMPRNIVLMGMGEPLDNYDAVMKALAILEDDRGHGFGASRITVSTVGVVPGILRMAEEQKPYNLAVSLHAASDAERSRLVRANRRWPLPVLMDACRRYNEKTGKRILFGWTLIAGENDHPEQAGAIVDLLQGLDAHVNLIRLNETGGYAGSDTSEQRAEAFQRHIRAGGIPCTLRQHRGIDVAAGCGQLRAARNKVRKKPDYQY